MDGFKDYDSVLATIRKGAITSLSPNPATSQVIVSYRLVSNIDNALIRITNAIGVNVLSCPINNSQTRIILNIQNFTNGQYLIQLLSSNGEVFDSKTIIVQ